MSASTGIGSAFDNLNRLLASSTQIAQEQDEFLQQPVELDTVTQNNLNLGVTQGTVDFFTGLTQQEGIQAGAALLAGVAQSRVDRQTSAQLEAQRVELERQRILQDYRTRLETTQAQIDNQQQVVENQFENQAIIQTERELDQTDQRLAISSRQAAVQEGQLGLAQSEFRRDNAIQQGQSYGAVYLSESIQRNGMTSTESLNKISSDISNRLQELSGQSDAQAQGEIAYLSAQQANVNAAIKTANVADMANRRAASGLHDPDAPEESTGADLNQNADALAIYNTEENQQAAASNTPSVTPVSTEPLIRNPNAGIFAIQRGINSLFTTGIDTSNLGPGPGR